MMENPFEPKPDAQQDKHEQANASLQDLQRVMTEYEKEHPKQPQNETAPQQSEQPAERPKAPAEQPAKQPVQTEQPEKAPADAPNDAPKDVQNDAPAEEKPANAAAPEQPATPTSDEQEQTQSVAEIEQEIAAKVAAEAARKAQQQAAKKQREQARADAEQKQREALLEKQAKRKHPDQPLATMQIKQSDKKKASGGKKPAAKKSVKSRKAAAARRRKKRLMRLGATVVVLLVLVVVVVSVVRGLSGKGNQLAGSGDTGSGVAVSSDNTTPKEKIDTSKPASQQESKQYKAIKDDTSLPSYALEYPGMYADAVDEPNVESEKKVCYLTFDDGPSTTNTPGILDALKQADVKATFFVVTSEINADNADILKRIVDEGHTLCIHANEHVYGDLYASVEAYLKDFATAYDKIYELTGYRAQGFRFPGGSNNAVMQRHNTYDAIVGEMTRRGFEYYDWNAYDHDAENGNYSVDQMVEFAVSEVTESSRNDTILLMHDTYGKEKTVQALPSIISRLKDAGIEMLPITNSSRPVHFEVNENTPPDLPQADSDADDADTDDTTDTTSDSDTAE